MVRDLARSGAPTGAPRLSCTSGRASRAGVLAATLAAGGAIFSGVALAAGLAGLRAPAALAGAFLVFTVAFGSALALAGVADEDLPGAFPFVVAALAVDLVPGGRAGAPALPLGLPAVLLGMLSLIRGTRGAIAPRVDGYIKRGAGSRA